ncbi:bifunctional diguanylate cyclase/phosphodiesterase [Marinomonas pollencensis]|uniref:Diguanylate cyclase/phosphodiesterase n=1 Tax=Marinomonas pollencensis TaxID=491954 RepID=A0A3E0DPU3_9GAMM|nr:EAL domain-containing protein [Marinomonas pollencensis]REG84976.1 diguanylate cyclase/phosphodiesterase [Marinomonas pollencensis]
MYSNSFYCTSLAAFIAQIKDQATPDLIQIYGTLPAKEMTEWVTTLASLFPSACRIGMSCEHHIFNGEIKSTGMTVIFSYFENTTLKHHCVPFSTQQEDVGNALFEPFVSASDSTPSLPYIVLTDNREFLSDTFFNYPNEHQCLISGGRAGHADSAQSWLLYQDKILQNHALAVGFLNPDLLVHREIFVDSITIGQRMLVTSSDGCLLKRLDHVPAQQIYQRCLTNGEHLPLSVASQFALQTILDGVEVNAVPLKLEHNGALTMSEPLAEGSRVQFLYINPIHSTYSATLKTQELAFLETQSIFVFKCISRYQANSQATSDNMRLINNAQTVNGVYCYGEFYSSPVGTKSRQHALTYVAFNESASGSNKETKALKLATNENPIFPILNLINNTLLDIEQERKSLSLCKNSAIENSWLYDFQTGLLNRYALLSRLQNDNDIVHLAVVKIRNFSLINEQYGYSVADDLVAQLAHQLKHQLTAGGEKLGFICYRLSANEIAVSIDHQISPKRALQVFHQLIENIEEGVFTSSDSVKDILTLTLSVGLASIKDNDGRILSKHEHLLIQASEARRIAQSNNLPLAWNGDNHLDAASGENLEWIQTIRQALEQDKVYPYFQPCFDSQSGQQISAEALLRVEIDGQVVGPFAFLNLIKQTQLYPKITQLMLAQCERLLNQYPTVQLALNLSILDFKNDKTLAVLRDFFRRNQVLGRLTLEITESESIQDYEWINPILREFRQAGALLAIDDFGAGYSNLEKLISLEPDILKLDGSIIKNIDHDKKMQKLVVSINKLAHSLDIKTQAEFVHSQAVKDFLVDIGVDYLQGFHLATPLSEQQWIKTLIEQPSFD